VLLCAIVVIMIGCDAQDEAINNAEVQKDYVQLAKEYEEEYLYKSRVLAKTGKNADSLLLSEQRLEEIKNDNGFDKQRIEAFRDSVFLIAKQYGIPREDIHLSEYFYINQQTGEIPSKDFFHKLFAYIKYSKEQAREQQRQLDELERKYIPKIEQAIESGKAPKKLIKEYQEKKEAIKQSI